MVLLKLEQFHHWVIKSILNVDSIFVEQIQSSMSFNPLVDDFKSNSSKSHDISKFNFKNDLLYFEGWLYIQKDKAQLGVF